MRLLIISLLISNSIFSQYTIKVNYDTLKYTHAMDIPIYVLVKLPEPKTITVEVPCEGMKTTINSKGLPTGVQNLKFQGRWDMDNISLFKDCWLDTIEVSKGIGLSLINSFTSTIIATNKRSPELENTTLDITLDNSVAAMDLRKLTNYKIYLKNNGKFTILNDWTPLPGSVISDNKVGIYNEGVEWDTATSKSFPSTGLVWRSTADRYSGTYSVEMKSTIGRSDIFFKTTTPVSNYSKLTLKLKQSSADLLSSGRFIWVLFYRNGVNVGSTYQIRNGVYGLQANAIWNSITIPIPTSLEFNTILLAYPAGLKSSVFIDDIQLEN